MNFEWRDFPGNIPYEDNPAESMEFPERRKGVETEYKVWNRSRFCPDEK